MRCPYCLDADSRVLDSRPSGEESVIRRRRQCSSCDKRFTTYERVEMFPMVVKSDGRREPFDERKLAAGIFRALVKLAIPAERVNRTIQEIKSQVDDQGQGEISSRDIGEMASAALLALDRVAYLRYVSVFRRFTDVAEFAEAAARLAATAPGEGTGSG